MLLKSLMQKRIIKFISEIPIYANFCYILAPKPVGRIDPGRLDRVNEGILLNFHLYNPPLILMKNVICFLHLHDAWQLKPRGTHTDKYKKVYLRPEGTQTS